jgi:hypothetical protein
MRNEYDRFMEKINKTDNGCWEWTGAQTRGGYGHFRRFVDGKWKMYKAHRYSYEYFKGFLEKHLLVCHRCDNPLCVNPEHLFKGTTKDNLDDMSKKGRRTFGRSIKHQWLDWEVVKSIRTDYAKGISQAELSRLYKISKSQINRVVNNQIWIER